MPQERIVLSASRRVELLRYPERFLKALDQYPSDRVHSIVLWTKTPNLLFESRQLMKRLLTYDQLYCHITITGLGSSFLEPNIPPYQGTIELLPKIIDFVKIPERVNIRFDPILNLVQEDDSTLSNFPLFPTIAEQCKEYGVKEFTISWVTAYKKVQQKLSAMGFVKFEADDTLKKKQASKLKVWEKELGVHIKGCCTQPFFPEYGCINGKLLTELHPRKEKCTLQKPAGQRQLCICTKSRDIGWYYSCPNGCAYCYAQPRFDLIKSMEMKLE